MLHPSTRRENPTLTRPSRPPQEISRITSSLPSSPPPAAIAEDGPRPTPRSPAFSTTSTADGDGGSSPLLPPLPAPRFPGNRSDHLRTPPRTDDGSSQYYTASWGSPYQQPASGERHSPHEYNRSVSSEPSVDSPIRHLEFHTPFLRPVPTFTRTQTDPEPTTHHGVSAAVLARRARRPAQGLTEDWIRQHTVGESTEGHNWLSDDPGDSGHSSLSGSISGDGVDWLQENDPKTPTLKSFLGRREQSRFDRIQSISGLLKRIPSTETLKQADFSDPSQPDMSASDDLRGLDMAASIEKELPPPPPPKEEPVWRASALPPRVDSIPPTPSPGPPRLKKKVPWKGKNIMVLLPWDDERGKRGKAPTPMREKDVVAMLRDWEQLGYDTTGFNLGHNDNGDEDASEGQSCSVWPNIESVIQERAQRSYKVSIPDKKEWDSYVRELSEAKLRALGVTLGDDEPVISPVPSAVSRRMSTQYPQLPFSPPLPASSAASSRANHNPFSPPLAVGVGPSASQSSINGSIASPASMHSYSQSKFNPRASISFMPGAHPFGSPFEYGQSSPGYSPGHHLSQSFALARGGSPNLQNLGSIMTPNSPFQEGYFPGDPMTQLQQRQQQLQSQLHQQQQIQMRSSTTASPRLVDLREVDDEEATQLSKSPSKTPEARVQKHNPSASLQKEIDDAEYHLEEQFQRQLEHEDYSPHSDHAEDHSQGQSKAHASNKTSVNTLGGLGTSRYADDPSGPVLHHPQPHSRGHSLSQRPFQDGDSSSDAASKSVAQSLQTVNENLNSFSDLDTNPSNIGTPVGTQAFSGHDRTISTISNPWVDSESQKPAPRRPGLGHGSKSSISKLNVAAKEFKFDPSNSFSPGQFSFTGASFQPSAPAFAPSAPNSATSSHFANRSSTSKINVAAPVFTPGQSEFSFSASGPSFRPDAPAFNPLQSNFSDSIGSGSDGHVPGSIFGSIDLGQLGIIKPPKKSKAIQIIRPDSQQDRDDETMEGKDGRITQGEGRFKRARGGKDDGDSVPLFAEPLEEFTRETSPPKDSTPVPVSQIKESSASESQEEEPSTFQFPKPQPFGDGSDHETKEFSPFEFHQQKQAEDFNAARPFNASRRYDSGLQPYGLPASPEQAKAVPVAEDPAPVEHVKAHKKNSLSATAKSFEFRPGKLTFNNEPTEPLPAAPVPKSAGLSSGLLSSRYAKTPSPPLESPEMDLQPEEASSFQFGLPQPESPPSYPKDPTPGREPTFEEIDAVMKQLNEAEMESAPRDSPKWRQLSPTRNVQVTGFGNSSPLRLQPQNLMRSDAPSPSPGRFAPIDLAAQRMYSRAQEDPFIGESATGMTFDSPIHRLNTIGSAPPSDWDDVISEAEEAKIEPRARFFDSHVNDIVGAVLEERLDPLERALESIQISLEQMAHVPARRRDARSMSIELPSDADDEDDEQPPRRSLSPRKDKKLERIRSIVNEAFAVHHASHPETSVSTAAISESANASIVKVLEEMKESFGQSLHLDLRGEDLRNVVEQAVEARMPEKVEPTTEISAKEVEQQARIKDLEEILRRADLKIEDQIKDRRAAEDRLAEVQRLLRISSEEEVRLREAVDERDDKIRHVVEERDLKVRNLEDSKAEASMRVVLLEAAQENSLKTTSDLHNRLNMTEDDLRDANEKVQRWQIEAERALEAAKRHSDDAEQANETNKDLRRTIETLRTQMEESIRVREGMRGKLMGLQEDMARATREIAQENAQRAKKEVELIARQEVLDAKLQAEARTRERLEMEIERLETGEREGMRAVNDCKKLEILVAELRDESHLAQKDAMRFKREYEEARESGLSEVQRTRHYMQAEIEAANNQVNVARDDLENQLARARAEVDQVKLDSDTVKARYEMLLEEANSSKITILEDLTNKHANEVEDIHTQHERQLNNTVEDAQRSEQHLLERLSLSSAKTEHLQDRVSHLEEKLVIAKAAAHAAAQAARSDRSVSGSSIQHSPAVSPQAIRSTRDPRNELPEKISPQALRESIMVLQEQLQDREQKIEKMEQTLSTVDLEAPIKITKRDDEIMWLRELLAVRKGDLQDIVKTLSGANFDPEAVKDAAIRLNANIQMEEQERERAMNGGSSLNLPNIAASLAASPRVAQAVGPLAAAWGNWRKSREPEANGSTPAKPNPKSQSLLSGLLTPPASARTPPAGQPTAFGSTGQRFTAEQLANRPRNTTPRKQGKMPMRGSPKRAPVPATPPMMRKGSYDMDAQAENFEFDVDDDEDDESTADDSFTNFGGRS
ncbi:myosin class II heavy chain [Phlyctema vagabunda]|uniref:Myosin class II heavy chain n=1 Tax=Phlyctema vagabunda TaxID=108571 RepID=A0ABR4P1M4_9HELO